VGLESLKPSDADHDNTRRSAREMKSSAAPPGLEFVKEVRDEALVFAILADLAGRTPGSWVSVMQIYASSPVVSHQNSLASCGLRPFVTPGALLKAALMEKCLAVQEKNGTWELRQRLPVGKRTNRAITAVLRYDTADWLKVSALQSLIGSRFGLKTSPGDLLLAVLADPVRFQVDQWEGEWWARATYRYPATH